MRSERSPLGPPPPRATARRHVTRAWAAAAVALVCAVPLTTGLAAPSAVAATAATPHVPVRDTAATQQRVTLITGDRVVLDGRGRVSGVEPARGRERVPLRVYRQGVGTLVVPADAHPLLATGKLDQRLFDVAELARASRGSGLKVIVGYRGSATVAKAGVRDTDGARVPRTLKTLNADVVTTPARNATGLWRTVTRENRSGSRALAAGIAHVWLDGVRRASLDRSVPQTGAPTAWAAGYDGTGVRVAVLDTGVDADHPDLNGQVVAAKNFSSSSDDKDHVGHGTHVASTVAGTGSRSAGRYKGVAPGAKLLAAKVLGDDGTGSDAGVLAGMEWAAEQGADIVNLSLGGPDRPGTDPLEAMVDRLSAEKNILFAVAAGNDGPNAGTVGSPGSADSALTVGAVDGEDVPAQFSSRGPRLDGAVKPDVTAPGVDITAASAPGSLIAEETGENPPGYTTISGTSMATPHVAGAAALLKQKQPDWGYAELKGALTGSAQPGAYSVFDQGTGRISVERALQQSVVADAPSVNFGRQQWPHTDDTPRSERVTYRNLGAKDVTLDVSLTGTDPQGERSPSGFFTLGARRLVVPAGGKASVDLTADTRLGGTRDGIYTASVVATGDGQSVRTTAAVEREIESYDVTLKYLDHEGEPASVDRTGAALAGIGGLASGFTAYPAPDSSGTTKLRVPKGRYVLDSVIYEDPADLTKGGDWLVRPRLDIAGNTTVTVDARTTRPTAVTVPDARARQVAAGSLYLITDADDQALWGTDLWAGSFQGLRTAHLGPRMAKGLAQQWLGRWVRGAGAEYDTISGGPVKTFATGYTKHFRANQFARVKAGLGASAPGKTGYVSAIGMLPSIGLGVAPTPERVRLPATRTLHVSTVDKAQWMFRQLQYGADTSEGQHETLLQNRDARGLAAGRTYRETFNTAVVGPVVGNGYGVFRDGDELALNWPTYNDGNDHIGFSLSSSAHTTLYRDGVKIADDPKATEGEGGFKVPPGEATYRLNMSVRRAAAIAAVSTRIDMSWTFRSGTTREFVELPLSVARLHPALALDSTALAGRVQAVPVTVMGAATGGNLRSLTVHASYDGGRTWKKVPVRDGRAAVRNPAKGRGIALRARVTDKKGTMSTVTVHNAYHGR
ncbi:S8 family peptidase [Streptomyces sp. AS02]|uniref:S8 family peptidase n=1 Tax=Streptomyces sp. AS02 TaxID=2938946 RepID=UPI00201FF459|nr:S8 family peptidase [Streptomyces sp. AS02]MCL8017270.1 S8 family peptidase [Streptomyces sp. AS02]